jgi:NADH-ubiquinone oxidoreductase chain 2
LIPPLIGFVGKQSVLYSSISTGYYFISIIAILTSIIGAYYYLKIIKTLLFTSSMANFDLKRFEPLKSMTSPLLLNFPMENTVENSNLNLKSLSKYLFKVSLKNDKFSTATNENNNIHSFLISFLTLIILLFVIQPSILLNSIRLLVLYIYYL